MGSEMCIKTDPYTRGLMAATPNLDQVSVDTVLPQIPGSMPSLADLPPGCRFHPRCGDAMPVCRQTQAAFIDGVACHLHDAQGQEAG